MSAARVQQHGARARPATQGDDACDENGDGVHGLAITLLLARRGPVAL